MSVIPARVSKRFTGNVRRFVKVLEDAKSRDINESDTVNIIVDMLAEIFGYDKYLEITSEFAIRNIYCDLAIKDGNDVRYLIECKAIGSDLKESHLRQAIEYASNSGIEWTILTNGSNWEVYKIVFSKPIEKELVLSIDFLNDNVKDAKFLEKLYILSKEALKKSAIASFHEERKALNKHIVAAIIQSEEVIKIIRKRIRLLFKGISIEHGLVEEIIKNDIIKREVINSDQTKSADKMLNRNSTKKRRRQKSTTEKNEKTNEKNNDNQSANDEVAVIQEIKSQAE